MSLEAGYPDAPGGVGYYIVGGGGSDVRSNAMKRRCDRCPPALEALGGEEGGWGGRSTPGRWWGTGREVTATATWRGTSCTALREGGAAKGWRQVCDLR